MGKIDLHDLILPVNEGQLLLEDSKQNKIRNVTISLKNIYTD